MEQIKGFTLIEVMVSLAILSMGLVLILKGFSHSLNVTRIAQDNLRATYRLENKMNEFEIKVKENNDEIEEQASNEEFSGEDIKYRLRIILSGVKDCKDLYKVNSSIRWQEGSREGEVPLDTYVMEYEEK